MKDNTYDIALGLRVRARREELGMTQDELAHKLGYKNRSTVSGIESGTRTVRQELIPKLADVLQTSLSYILGSEQREKMDELMEVISGLSPEQLESLLQIALILKGKQQS